MIYYHLTTPLMKDGRKGVTGIAALQRLLAGQNSLKTNFAPGLIDGEYGEKTARAVMRAKFWYGYTQKNITGVAGDTIIGLLRGTKKMSVLQQIRRAARLKAAQQVPLRKKALKIHLSHVGETEQPPNSNRSWATKIYGMIGAWCAMACSVAAVLAGSKISFRLGARWAYVPYMEQDARAGLYKLAVVGPDEIEEGDYVTFHWDEPRYGRGGRDGDHVEQFIKWLDRAAGVFQTVGSNTSFEGQTGSQSDGGATAIRTRHLADVNYFIHWTEK